MKSDIGPRLNPERSVDDTLDPTGGVAYDVATRLGYGGAEFPRRFDHVKDVLHSLQQPALTPEARAAVRALATRIINANPESFPADSSVFETPPLPAAPQPGQRAGYFNPERLRGNNGQ